MNNMDKDKLDQLIIIYFNVLRMCNTYSSDGIDWEVAGLLPAWKRGPYWHNVGEKNFNRLEGLLGSFLDNHYPMWNAIHGDSSLSGMGIAYNKAVNDGGSED